MSGKSKQEILPALRPSGRKAPRGRSTTAVRDKTKVSAFRDPREKLFADRYIETGLARQAALEAGYSKHTAIRNAIPWTQPDGPKPHVYNYIQKHEKRATQTVLARIGITKEKIITEMAKLAFSNIGDIVDIDRDGLAKINLNKADRAKLASITELESTEIYEGRGEQRKLKGYRTKVKLADKSKALQLLGKEAGLFADTVEHAGKDGEPLKVLIAPFDADLG